MHKKSINFTAPNDTWIKSQIESQEYGSISDVVNDVIRRERAREQRLAFIRAKLIASEKSGYVDQSPAEILAEFKEEARANGDL